MVDCYASLSRNLLKLAIGDGVAHVKEDGMQDDAFGKISPFEIDRIRFRLNQLQTLTGTQPDRHNMFATEPKEPFKQVSVENHKRLSTLHLASSL